MTKLERRGNINMKWNKTQPKDQDPPLPKDYLDVLCVIEYDDGRTGMMVTCYASVEQSFAGEGPYHKVTHWQYLPELPDDQA
jgi:hypothetical protein